MTYAPFLPFKIIIRREIKRSAKQSNIYILSNLSFPVGLRRYTEKELCCLEASLKGLKGRA
jgi:hypothetical protein